MTEFEKVLGECLYDLERGASNVDECLSRHPQYARELEPILLASTYLERVGEVHVSDAFKARVRARLMQEMQAHPHTSGLKPAAARSTFMFRRLAVSFAVVLLALLVTGTAYAQRTLPGDAFYGWKRASENAWRAVSPDPVATDLVIAERRVDELMAVRDDPVLRSQTLEAYLETATRLRSELTAENEARVLDVLDSQVQDLNLQGILPEPPVQDSLPPSDEPTQLPTSTPLPASQTPRVDGTDLPQIIPTIEVPPDVLPTVEIPREVIPTVEIPLDILP
jgi:hypothetical protein